VENSVVIALHGFLGWPSDWQKWAEQFANGKKFLAINLWEDPLLHSSQSWDEWTQQFIRFVETQKKHTSHIELWGYSMGGRLAMSALNAAPSLFDKAVIVSANPGLRDLSERPARFARDQQWSQKFLQQDWATLMHEWNQQPVLQESTPVDKSVYRLETQFQRQRLADALVNWSVAKQPDYRAMLRNLNIAVDWHVGELDKIYLAMGEEVRTLNPHLQLIVHPQRGHRLIL
jgi:2-succinyl-6-hydroxy-2,4-cyclohexadiene-1-carboxylate synthase